MADRAEPYLDLITSEHNQAPKFRAVVTACVTDLADAQAEILRLYQVYDLDVAIGDQLDTVGRWVGVSRYLTLPLVGVYFSFDQAGVGLDEGTWLGPYDPVSGLVALPDDYYRTLIRATIAANHWDGTIPHAYEIWNTLFQPAGFSLGIFDHQDMSMDLAIFGPTVDAVTRALILNGYLNLRPAGVRINNFFVPSVTGAPLFGLDMQNSKVSGLDTGAWAVNL